QNQVLRGSHASPLKRHVDLSQIKAQSQGGDGGSAQENESGATLYQHHGDGHAAQQGGGQIAGAHGLARGQAPFPQAQGEVVGTSAHHRNAATPADEHDEQHVENGNSQNHHRREGRDQIFRSVAVVHGQ